jgi:hypothetical protein
MHCTGEALQTPTLRSMAKHASLPDLLMGLALRPQERRARSPTPQNLTGGLQVRH